jgi:D-glycero-D-manno-heptose 1,7-bisphosphate phosphatase
MILQAAREHEIDLSRSILIGDKPSDIEAAAAAGVGRSFLVGPTGEGERFAEALAALKAP